MNAETNDSAVKLPESVSVTAKPYLVGTNFDRELAYGILRFTLGINILLHGLVPLTNLESFAVNILHLFTKTPQRHR
jgi:hypothetical protein